MNTKHTGFTLIELLVVITMIGILAAISVPDFRGYQMRENLRSSVTETQAFLAEAFAASRAESQKQQVSIVSDQELEFCAVQKDGTVTTECKQLNLPGSVTMEIDPAVITTWDYTAPHGDISGLSSAIEIVFTHNSGTEKRLKIHPASGLIEEIL